MATPQARRFRCWVPLGPGRELDKESTPPAGLTLDSRPPAHPLHGLSNDGQADPRTRVGLGAVQPLENAEDPLVVLGGNSNAVVLDPKANGAGRLGLSAYPDMGVRPRRDEFCGVRDQVLNRKRQGKLVSPHSRQRGIDFYRGIALRKLARQLQ